jgi:hypothetical protein
LPMHQSLRGLPGHGSRKTCLRNHLKGDSESESDQGLRPGSAMGDYGTIPKNPRWSTASLPTQGSVHMLTVLWVLAVAILVAVIIWGLWRHK